MEVVSLFTEPESYFDRNASGGYRGSVAVILVAAGLSGGGGIYSTWWLFGKPGLATPITYVLSALIGVAIPLLIWLIASVLFHGIATMFADGDASFTELLRWSAYGMAPYAIASAISLVLTFFVFQEVGGPTAPSEIRAASIAFQNHTLTWASNVVVLASLLWSGDLWASAVRHTYDVDERTALKVVAVPVLLVLGLGFLVLV